MLAISLNVLWPGDVLDRIRDMMFVKDAPGTDRKEQLTTSLAVSPGKNDAGVASRWTSAVDVMLVVLVSKPGGHI